MHRTPWLPLAGVLTALAIAVAGCTSLFGIHDGELADGGADASADQIGSEAHVDGTADAPKDVAMGADGEAPI